MDNSRELIGRRGELEVRVLAGGDAAGVEALRKGYTSHENEWVYRGTAEEFIAGARHRFASGQGFWAGVWAGGTVVGLIGLNDFNPWSRCASLDYLLGTKYRGR